MEAIGGYFSLELPKYEEYHKGAIKLNTGRNCLEYILRVRRYNKVYIPYYTCEVILEPFKKLNISYEFYHINLSLELAEDICLKEGEALLYTNYYGLKQRYVEKMAERYGKRLIVDNTQAFYAKPIDGIDTFYTCRKFFGVPDGAYLYIDTKLEGDFEQDTSYDRMTHLLKRIDLSAEEGYADFRKADDGLDPLDDDTVPMVYPFLVPIKGLREKLIDNKVFVACYWPNVQEWTTKDDFEFLLALQMLPLPIDQRNGKKELLHIIQIICNIR